MKEKRTLRKTFEIIIWSCSWWSHKSSYHNSQISIRKSDQIDAMHVCQHWTFSGSVRVGFARRRSIFWFERVDCSSRFCWPSHFILFYAFNLKIDRRNWKYFTSWKYSSRFAHPRRITLYCLRIYKKKTTLKWYFSGSVETISNGFCGGKMLICSVHLKFRYESLCDDEQQKMKNYRQFVE